jgi:hypothetical protein
MERVEDVAADIARIAVQVSYKLDTLASVMLSLTAAIERQTLCNNELADLIAFVVAEYKAKDAHAAEEQAYFAMVVGQQGGPQ